MSLMMETSTTPEALAYASSQERVVILAEENARRVSCRKFLMTLCAVHPARAAKLLVAPAGSRYSNEPEPELTPTVLAAKKRTEIVPKETEESGRLTVMAICEVVARHYEIKLSDLLSLRRTHDVLIPRHVAMYLAKTLTDKTLPGIGRAMGDRDHTTILSAVRRIERLRKERPDLNETIEFLSATLSRKEAA